MTMSYTKIVPILFCVLATLIHTKEPVYAGIASVPWRKNSLKRTVHSLVRQVDHLFIYLNNYDEVPDFLDHPKITYHLSSETAEGDLGDRGKFYHVAELTGYYLSCDDDLIYPLSYVHDCIDAIERYQRKAIIGFHGLYIPDTLKQFRQDLWICSYGRHLGYDTYVHMLGTGAMAFHTDTIALSLEDFPVANMADVFVGIKTQTLQIPMICLTHPNRYIDCTEEAWDTRSIWDTTQHNCPLETYLCRLFIPWKKNTI